MILLNTSLSAANAKQCGLVTEVMKSAHFEKDLKSSIRRLLSVPLQVLPSKCSQNYILAKLLSLEILQFKKREQKIEIYVDYHVYIIIIIIIINGN